MLISFIVNTLFFYIKDVASLVKNSNTTYADMDEAFMQLSSKFSIPWYLFVSVIVLIVIKGTLFT